MMVAIRMRVLKRTTVVDDDDADNDNDDDKTQAFARK